MTQNELEEVNQGQNEIESLDSPNEIDDDTGDDELPDENEEGDSSDK